MPKGAASIELLLVVINTTTHSNARLGLSKKKMVKRKSHRKTIDRILPHENKSMNESDEELGEAMRIPYTSALPAPAEGINAGFKKSEIRNL